jgi:hypothetical protein
MKKILLIALLGFTLISNAQDFKKISNLVLLKQIEQAKVELDKIMSDPKVQSKPDGWFWKTKIYAFFYNDSILSLKYPKSEVTADEAFKKYVSLDPSLKLLKAPENMGQDALFYMYSQSFNNGIVTFTAKKWDSAFYYFSLAVDYSDVIFQNKFSKNQNQAFDTTSILYAGYSAQNAQKSSGAVKNFDRLITNNISGQSYIDIYRYCLINSIDNKDSISFYKYLNFSKSKFPKEDWEDYELSYFNKNYTSAQKSELYDKEDATGGMSAKKYLQYGETFDNMSREGKETSDSIKTKYLLKAADAFKKAFNLSPDGLTAFNAGIMYYNIFGIYDDKVSQYRRALQELNSDRVVEKDPKKKAVSDAKFKAQSDSLKAQRSNLEKPMADAADSSIFWLEKEFAILKDKSDKSREEKNCLNKSVDYLANVYSYKREKSRGKDPKAYDTYDAKFKTYDELHDTFK